MDRFPQYVLVFITRRPLGFASTLIAVLVSGYFWKIASPYYPTAVGVSCAIILLLAFVSFLTE